MVSYEPLGEALPGHTLEAILRVERKLDILIAALAEEEEPIQTLDGQFAGSERDETQPL